MLVKLGDWRTAAHGLRRFLHVQSGGQSHAHFRRLSPVDHVLIRPEVYMGSMDPVPRTMWIPTSVGGKWRILPKQVTVIPAFAKIFDEILVNAADNFQRDPTTSRIDVTVNPGNRMITIANNGQSPPIVLHPEEKVLIPEMIFGTLLTGSNFSDAKENVRTTAGRHGYGAKLTNIMSNEFDVEIVDSQQNLTYQQSWFRNMRDKNKAVVNQVSPDAKSYTKVSFAPDFDRFKMTHLTDDVISVMQKRTWDVAACLVDEGVTVTWNGKPVPFSSFQAYCGLHGEGGELTPSLAYGSAPKFHYGIRLLSATERAAGAPNVSFVNSVVTYRGGTHVNYLLERINRTVKSSVKASLSLATLRQHTLVFAKSIVDKPQFESQSKEMLTNTVDSIKGSLQVGASFLKDVKNNTGIVERVKNIYSETQWKALAAQERKSYESSKRLVIPKLEDAVDAGTRRSRDCTLILTEGDSAKALAMAGLSVVGRKEYGVFPLRGKLLNVRAMSNQNVAKNVEIAALVKILGLKYGQDYSSFESRKRLRYGKVMVMTDQDHDGYHIQALLLNIFDKYWPSLLRVEGFFETFRTPIVKVRSPTFPEGVKEFFELSSFEKWFASTDPEERKKMTFKYYKGLGTNTREEGQEYFRNIEKHRRAFSYDDGVSSKLDLIFQKEQVEQRRTWMKDSVSTERSADENDIDFGNFIDTDVRDFSTASLTRAVPSVVDGLKPSQRKILFSSLKKSSSGEIKVAQLAGFTSEQTAYHHGESSLNLAIVRLAQDFVGSNNIPLLMPKGQFGTRLEGGEDSASARYLFTKVSPLTRKIFMPEDDPILESKSEDGQQVEPNYFLPIIPMILVNGSRGIGSGYASRIPSYNPLDIIDNVLLHLDGMPMRPIIPWFRGHLGETIERGNGDLYTRGVFEFFMDKKMVRVHELPAQMWTETYRNILLAMEAKKTIVRSYREKFTDSTICFDINLTDHAFEKALRDDDSLYKLLRLERRLIACYNVFNEDSAIRTFSGPLELMEEFLKTRVQMYSKRKSHMLEKARVELNRLSNQSKFAKMISSQEIKVLGQPMDQVARDLAAAGFDDQPAKGQNVSPHPYAYLLNIPVSQLTLENAVALDNKKNKVRDEYEALEQRDPVDMYRQDVLALRSEIVKEMKPGGCLGVTGDREELLDEIEQRQGLSRARRVRRSDSSQPTLGVEEIETVESPKLKLADA